MQDIRMKKHGVWLATAALVAEMGITGIANAADNPFKMTELAAGYQLASQDKHDNDHEHEHPAKATKTEATSEGDQGHNKEEKKTTAEGKCGADHMKLNEGKCGGSGH